MCSEIESRMSAKSTKRAKPNSTDRGTIEEVIYHQRGVQNRLKHLAHNAPQPLFTALACVVLLHSVG